MCKKFILPLLIVFYSQIAFTQSSYVFTKGLFIDGVHHYGREAIYSDSLAFQLYNQTLEKPSTGKTFWNNASGISKKWQEINANKQNVFEARGFRMGGYLYLTYESDKSKNVLLQIKGNSSVYVNGVLHAGDPYSSGWLYIPIKLKKGENEFYVRRYFRTSAELVFPEKPVSILTSDSTVPHIVLNLQNEVLQGAVVVINTSSKDLHHLKLDATVAGKKMTTLLPSIPALSSRKVVFSFDASNINKIGKQECSLTLIDNNKTIDEKNIMLEAVEPSSHYSTTFISDIDNSLQYYSITPQLKGIKENAALFLSVHGAGVEAIGQARAYQSKDWGTLVAATNRRPRGFNWEDWGRLDAIEVLTLAKEKLKPDPNKIYLTGHSMGGHGTWYLGATYPGNWAAIAPCAGYPTLKSYGSADGLIPDSSKNKFEQLLLRAGNQSDVIKLANNYKPYGVYVFHGDADRVVSVNYARQMKKVLADFHPDFSYYEYPGGEHWFGNESVDWNPLFDFFKWHSRPSDNDVNQIDFTTSSPGISSEYRWAGVIQQIHPLQFSRIQFNRDISAKKITGTTQNCKVIKLALTQFGINSSVTIDINNSIPIVYKTNSVNDTLVLELKDGNWVIGKLPSLNQKGPHRYGTFKDGFRNKMVYVYGTVGTSQENEWSLNKARYDAETWYYRGNGAVDIISDKEYSIEKYKDRGVVLYGNYSTNAAWTMLLDNCPIKVERNKISSGKSTWIGDDLAAYFVWPISGSDIASVSVVAGSGIKGMNAAHANQYFAGASGFPDFMIFSLDMLQSGANGIKQVGFFDNEWKIREDEIEE